MDSQPGSLLHLYDKTFEVLNVIYFSDDNFALAIDSGVSVATSTDKLLRINGPILDEVAETLPLTGFGDIKALYHNDVTHTSYFAGATEIGVAVLASR